MKKRILSIILTLALCLSMLPATALAAYITPQSATQCGSYYIYYYAETTATQCVSYDADSGVITVTNPPNSNTIFISSDSNVSNSTSTGCTTITGVDASFKIEASPSQITLLSGRLEFNSGMVVSGANGAWKYTISGATPTTVDANGELSGSGNVSLTPDADSTATVKWDDGTTLKLTAASDAEIIIIARSTDTFTLTNVEQVECNGMTYKPLTGKTFQLLIDSNKVEGFSGTATVPAGTTLGIGLANLADVVTVQCAAEREISCYYSETNFKGYPTLEGVGKGDTITVNGEAVEYLTLAGGILTENEVELIAGDAENTFTINSLYAADDSATPSITLTKGGFQNIPAGTLIVGDKSFTAAESINAHIVGEALCWHSGEVTAPEGSKIEIGLCAESAGGSHHSQVYEVTAGTFQLKGDTSEANKALSYLPTGNSLTPESGGITGEKITAKVVSSSQPGIHFHWEDEDFLLDQGESIQIGSTTYTADTTTDTVEVPYNGAVLMDNGEQVTITAGEDNPKVIFTDSVNANILDSNLTIPAGTVVIERKDGGSEGSDGDDYFALVQGHVQMVFVDSDNPTDGPITVNGWEINPVLDGGYSVDVTVENGAATVSGGFAATKDNNTLTFTDPSKVTIDAAGNVTLVDGHVKYSGADSADIHLGQSDSPAITLGASGELAYDKDAAEPKVTLYGGTISNLSQAIIVDGSGILFEPQDGAAYDIINSSGTLVLTVKSANEGGSGSVDVTLPQPNDSIYCTNSMSCTNPSFSNVQNAQYVSGVLDAKMNFAANGSFTYSNPTSGVTYENSTVTLGTTTQVVLDTENETANDAGNLNGALNSLGIDYTNTTATDSTSITLKISEATGMAEVTEISGDSPTLKVTGDANVFANGNLWAVSDGSEIQFTTDSNGIVGILTSGTVELAAGGEIGIAADTSDGSLEYKTAVGPATVSVEDGITYVTAHGEAARAVKQEGSGKYTIPEDGAVFAVDTALPYPILIEGTAKATINGWPLRFGTTTASRYVESDEYGVPIVVTMDKDTLTATITANDNGDAAVKELSTYEKAILTIASGSQGEYTIGENPQNDTATLVGAGCAANSSIPVTAGDITVTPQTLGTQSFSLYQGTADGDITLAVTQPVTVSMKEGAVLKLIEDASGSGTDYADNSTISNITTITAVTDATLTINAGYAITCDSLTDNLGNKVTVGSTKPAAPTLTATAPTYAGGSDGKITGVTTAMEWKAASGSDYTACTGTVITGLAAGTYYVRVAETTTTLASEYASVTVHDGAPRYDITVNGGVATPHKAVGGASVNLEANAPADGYQFKAWEGLDGLTITTGNVNSTSLIFTMPSAAVEVTATYEPVPPGTHSVTVHHGTVSPTGAQTAGTAITITANAAESGQRFKAWEGLDGLTITSGSATTETVTFNMPDAAVEVTATYETIPDITVTHTVTFDSDGGSAVAAQTVTDGQTVAKPANPTKNGYNFKSWQLSGVDYDFSTPVRSDITLKALWEEVQEETPGSTGGNTGGGGGGSPGSTSVTVPISGDEETIHVNASVKGDTAIIDKVDLSKLDTVIGDHVDTGTVTIDFSGLKTSKPITTVEIPSNVVKEIAAAVNDPTNDAESLEIILSDGTSIEFDAEALGEKAAQADGLDITISIKQSSGTGKQQSVVGARTAYDISVTSGGEHISDMGGMVTVHAPYELKDGELPRGIIVYYVDDNGNKEACVTSYDSVKKRVNWKTDHLSLYMIDYDESLLNPFTDVSEDAYYFDAVLWAVDEGITNGTSAATFSPDASCTRAQMATFLWRAAGSPDPVGSSNPFTDVSADAYHAKAVQWAVEQDITVGTSDTTFSPDADCTRAQMATFLWRNAGSPATASVSNPFTDVPAEAYYAAAVQWAYEQEITGGTSATTFSPNNICTRAQMVTFLYRYFVK